ncbi:MAG: hypothetical protein JSV96_13075 [Candidatus Aminicenantes bacterium]|nr:MAG: hypothetical protein JSV96_13075 [Candidatus Aminicenantes bacterium]
MFRVRSRKRKKYKESIKKIDEEINRSKRFKLNFAVLAIEVSHSTPSGLSKLLPGKVIFVHVIQRYIRSYDQMISPQVRRYYFILPRTSREGANKVKSRIYKVAQEKNWGAISIGMAFYPEDAKSSKALLDKALDEIS